MNLTPNLYTYSLELVLLEHLWWMEIQHEEYIHFYFRLSLVSDFLHGVMPLSLHVVLAQISQTSRA